MKINGKNKVGASLHRLSFLRKQESISFFMNHHWIPVFTGMTQTKLKGRLGGILIKYFPMNSKGLSVLFLVFAMLLMVTIGYVFSYLIPAKQKSIIFPIHSNQAFYIAQSGVEFAIRYSSDRGWRSTTDLLRLNNPGVNQRNIGNGSFTIRYTADLTGGVLTSTGEITGSSERRIIKVSSFSQFLKLVFDPASPAACMRPPVPPPEPPDIKQRARFYIKYVGTNSVTLTAFSTTWTPAGSMRLTAIYMFDGGAWVQKYGGSYASGSGSINFNLGGNSQTITPNQVIPVLIFWDFDLSPARDIIITFFTSLGDSYIFNLDPEGDGLPSC